MRSLTELIKEYPKNTAIIRYKMPDGSIRDWPISAKANFDSEISLREHLRKWMPEAEFLDWTIRQVPELFKRGNLTFYMCECGYMAQPPVCYHCGEPYETADV